MILDEIRYSINIMVMTELELREGQANDALEALHEHLQLGFCLLKQKQVHA
jgi:hypothetical protein